jgi:hypothetical protein
MQAVIGPDNQPIQGHPARDLSGPKELEGNQEHPDVRARLVSRNGPAI